MLRALAAKAEVAGKSLDFAVVGMPEW